MKTKRQLPRFIVFSLSMLLLFSQTVYSQSGIIDFEDSKWNSVIGHKLYRGGPSNTLTDSEMGVDFIISYGEMMVEDVYLMGRMLFFSPIITSNGTTDDVGRVLIRFSNLKESVKLDVSHDYTEVHSPAYMTVKFYRSHDPNNPLYSEDVPWNSGAFTEVEYSNTTDGIQMVIVDTKYAENNIDNIEFTEMGGTPSALELTVVSNSAIDLEWQDNSDDEDGFEIERKTGAGGSWSQIGTVSANMDYYGDSGLSSNTTYYYRVRAYGTGWTSPYSNEANAATLGSPPADMFDFNDGTDQEWTLTGAYDEDGDGPFQSNFVFDWNDQVNYSNTPFTDPMGNNNGSVMVFTSSAHGINNPSATWWIMQFHSPDLSSSSTWQTATGYTVEIADAMSTDGTLYCNLYVKVYDIDQSRDRYFYSGGAQALQHYSALDWNHLSFDWSGVAGFPTNYTLEEVYVNIWGRMANGADGGVFLDDVTPVGGTADQTPAPPSNLEAFNLSPQIHLTWNDNSDDETGFILEMKDSPSLIPGWQIIGTLDANVTSYQVDNPILNHTYTFRIVAYNEYGNSNYSNEVTFPYLLTIYWLSIQAPNGGEIWPPGETRQITWNSGTISPPSQVTVTYSTDGGSNWIDPPVASNISNTGSYSWTIPNTPSANCIVKVEDASDGYPYDLTNHPFTIGTLTDPVLSVTPTTLDFGLTSTDLTFQISNDGGGSLTWSVAENPDKTWITSITPSSGTNDATVTVTVDRSQLSGNSDSGSLAVTTNDGNQDITVLISKEDSNLPDSWDFTANTGNNATVILPTDADPNIDGTPLENDDYIGAFTPDGLCCGWSQWQGQNISIAVWGNDGQTAETDGFLSDEVINYRVYRLSEQKEWTSVSVDYSQGTGTYSADAFMVLSQFDASENTTLSLNFIQGWNMFSINVDPTDPAVETVMAPIANDLVIMKNGSGQTYIPAYGINNIGDIDFTEGYKAYLNQAVSLDVTGPAADPATPITLPTGWSMISYLPDAAMDADVALASIASELVIAKDGAGSTYIPAYGINQIGQMQPGQGYKVNLNSAGTLIYPSGDLPKIIAQTPANKTPEYLGITLTDHFQFTSNTGENATVVLSVSINPQYSDGSPLEVEDEIGVFTSAGLCCGAVVWEGVNTAITVWGDDTQTDSVDGFFMNDTLRFRVWNKSDDSEYLADVRYDAGSPSVYQADGLFVLSELIADLTTHAGKTNNLVMPLDFKLFQNYPNPFNPETQIRYALPVPNHVRIEVYNLVGKKVITLIDREKNAGFHTVTWNGRDGFGKLVSSGIYLCRIQAGNYQQTIRLSFLK